MSYIAFDIEIVKPIPEDVTDWKTIRPLGISCAVTYEAMSGVDFGKESRWYRGSGLEYIGDQMSIPDTWELIDYLMDAVIAGHQILTWNGLGFDFDILAEESGRFQDCRELAINHIDMMFHIFCECGYPLGLNTAAKGMGLAGKTEGMDGALAPKYWAEGRRQEVLDYCSQDVRTTYDLAVLAQQRGALRWTSRKGRPMTLALPADNDHKWRTVEESLDVELPDNSWMDDPWDRERFTSWMEVS